MNHGIAKSYCKILPFGVIAILPISCKIHLARNNRDSLFWYSHELKSARFGTRQVDRPSVESSGFSNRSSAVLILKCVDTISSDAISGTREHRVGEMQTPKSDSEIIVSDVIVSLPSYL